MRSALALLKTSIGAALFGFCAVSYGAVLNFEAAPVGQITNGGGETIFGSYFVDAFAGDGGTGPAGIIVDGSNPASCVGFACPANNTTRYYASLNDSFFLFGLDSGEQFSLISLDASFIGDARTAPASPALAGLLELQGYDASGVEVGATQQVPLFGASDGTFSFGTYVTSADYQALTFSYIQVIGFRCNTENNCTRGMGLASFGIDNIVTRELGAEVPEPASLALLMFGLFGFAAARKRSV